MKTIYIVGLSLGGNKGGPAILASLVALLRANINPLRIVVVSSNIKNDSQWQHRYDVELVPLPKPREAWKLLTLYRDADLVLDMHGVKFAGTMKISSSLYAISPLVFPRLFGIPTVAYTQTYGPFENTLARFSARFSLRATNLLFVREPQSAEILNQVGFAGKYQLYPDVALTLPRELLADINCAPEVKHLLDQPFIGLSISSKVIQEEKHLKLEPRYQKLMTDFIEWLLKQGHHVLLIPHVYMPYSPANNDYELIEQIYNQLAPSHHQLLMVREDLPPEALKTIISRSHIFIGSRYHSLVAALSTGVPALSIGWSHKYEGLLGLFGMERFATWANHVSLTELQTMTDELLINRASYATAIKEYLPELLDQVKDSGYRVAQLLA